MPLPSITHHLKNTDGSAADPRSGDLRLCLRMLAFLRPVRSVAIVACAIVVARVVAEVLAAYFLSPAVTAVATGLSATGAGGFWQWIRGDDASAVQLRGVMLWMLGSQAVFGLLIYLRTVSDTRLSMRVVYHIRGAIFDRLQNVDLAFHDRMTSGQLINRALSDLQAVRTFINTAVLACLDVSVSIAAYMLLLFSRSPWLMAASLIPVPLWIWVIVRFGRKVNALYKHQQEASDRVVGALSENLSGVQVVRAFGTQAQETSRYRALNQAYLGKLFSSVRVQAQLAPGLRAVTTGAHILLFVLSAWLIGQGRLQIGDLMILGMAMGSIVAKLQQVNQIAEVYQRGIVSARRLFEILDTPPVTQGAPKGSAAPEPAPVFFRGGETEFENVVFGYDPDRPILKGVNARLAGGQVTALLGPTGSGKSTFAGLLSRFYAPQAGSIRIDGQDLRSINLRDLRHAVGYCFQETFLFTDTIRNNIRYGRRDVSDEMLKAAVRAAHADEFIESLPDGYDTLLGERGVMLSGGQRQRLALARALVYDPGILIMDDATASLDPKTEAAIQELLKPLFKGRTVLMIAHRLGAVVGAQHLLLMKDGLIHSGDFAIEPYSHGAALFQPDPAAPLAPAPQGAQ